MREQLLADGFQIVDLPNGRHAAFHEKKGLLVSNKDGSFSQVPEGSRTKAQIEAHYFGGSAAKIAPIEIIDDY